MDRRPGYHAPGADEFNSILHDFDDSEPARKRAARHIRIAFFFAISLVLISALIGTASRPSSSSSSLSSDFDAMPGSEDESSSSLPGSTSSITHSPRTTPADSRDDSVEEDDQGDDNLPEFSPSNAEIKDALGLTPLGKNLSDTIPNKCPKWFVFFSVLFMYCF